jgi:hypothetical protein
MGEAGTCAVCLGPLEPQGDALCAVAPCGTVFHSDW